MGRKTTKSRKRRRSLRFDTDRCVCRFETLEHRHLLAVSFNDFSDPTGILLVANASVDAGSLLLSDDGIREGAAWWDQKEVVSASFETEFDFRVTTSRGFAFVIQNHELVALGTHNLGYEGLPNSLAIEFDWRGGSHVAVMSRGVERNSSDPNVASLGSAALPFDLRDGQTHTALVRYDAGVLSVFVDDASQPLLEIPLDIGDLLDLDSGRAWLGFTAHRNFQEVTRWRFDTLTDLSTTVGVDDATVLEGDSETTEAEFRVTRTGTAPVTLQWRTVSDSAIGDSDFESAAGTIDFTAGGPDTQTITVAVIGDQQEEAFENFTVEIEIVAGSATLVDDRATGTILNDDATLVIVDAAAVEGGREMAFIDVFAPRTIEGMSRSRGVDIGPDGNLYVSSENGPQPGAVLRYDPTSGAFIDVFALDIELDASKDVEFGPDGHLYVSNNRTHRIQRFDGTTGEFLGDFVESGGGGLLVPRQIVFGADGNLYVGSAGTSQVLRYQGPFGSDPGAFMDVFIDEGVGGLRSPTAMIFGPDGILYVAAGGHEVYNNSVLKFSGTTGAFLEELDLSGTSELALVPTGGIRFGPDLDGDGTAELFASNGDGPNEVLAFSGATGEFLLDFIPADLGGLDDPKGFVFQDDGSFVVVAAGTDTLHRFAATSQAAVRLQLSRPIGTPLGVDFRTVDGDAIAGLNYEPRAGSVVFEPGQTEISILVQTIDGAFANDGASFGVLVESDSSRVMIGDAMASVVIADDDTAMAEVGDYNRDGAINDLDRDLWASSYSHSGSAHPADGNGDGIVDAADYTVWRDALDAAVARASQAEMLRDAALLGFASSQLPLTAPQAVRVPDTAFEHYGSSLGEEQDGLLLVKPAGRNDADKEVIRSAAEVEDAEDEGREGSNDQFASVVEERAIDLLDG